MGSFVAAALEGDHCDRLPEIARSGGRRPVGAVLRFDGWEPVAPLAAQPNHLVAAVSGGWTVLVDDGETTGRVFDHPDVAAALVERFGCRVAAGFAYSTTGCCGYRVHTPGGGFRSVIVQERVVTEDIGEPLPGEDTTDLHLHDLYSVLEVLALLGLDVSEGVEASTRCAVVKLAAKQGKRSG